MPESAPDLAQEIAEAATEPQSAVSDGQTATARSLSDLIAADKYLKAKQVARCGGPFAALKVARVNPGGAAGC